MIIHSGLVARLARVAGVAERVDDLETLEKLLLAVLRILIDQIVAQRRLRGLSTSMRRSSSRTAGAPMSARNALSLSSRAFCLEIQELFLVEQLIRAHVLLARIDDDVVRVVDDFFEITQRKVDEVSHRRRQRLEEPYVRDGNGEFDVTHALATNAAQGDFDAATVADHAAIAYALVLAAMAFPVLYRTEDALAE